MSPGTVSRQYTSSRTYTLHGTVQTGKNTNLLVPLLTESLVGDGDESSVEILQPELVEHDTTCVDGDITRKRSDMSSNDTCLDSR